MLYCIVLFCPGVLDVVMYRMYRVYRVYYMYSTMRVRAYAYAYR